MEAFGVEITSILQFNLLHLIFSSTDNSIYYTQALLTVDMHKFT